MLDSADRAITKVSARAVHVRNNGVEIGHGLEEPSRPEELVCQQKNILPKGHLVVAIVS